MRFIKCLVLAALVGVPGTAIAQRAPISGQPVTVFWAAGSVTTAGTFTTALGANQYRRGCQIQNTSTSTEYIGSSGSPTETNTFQIAAGATYNCATGNGYVDAGLVQITSGAAGATYVVASW